MPATELHSDENDDPGQTAHLHHHVEIVILQVRGCEDGQANQFPAFLEMAAQLRPPFCPWAGLWRDRGTNRSRPVDPRPLCYLLKPVGKIVAELRTRFRRWRAFPPRGT